MLILAAASFFFADPLAGQTASSTAAEDVILEEGPEEVERSFLATVRSSIRLEARGVFDTRFDREGEHVAELGLGARLELEADLAEDVSAFVAPSFYYVAAFDRDADDREAVYLTTPETRISASFGAFDLRAGALIFNWGASDLVGPSDVLNPLDYRRNFVAAIDDAKIPVVAVELAGHFGPLTVRGVIEPFFTPPRFFLSGWDTSLLQSQLTRGLDIPQIEALLGEETVDDVGDRLLISERPSDRPDDATFAARATLRIDDLDLSATAVHGWEPLPEVTVHPDLRLLASRIAEAVANRRPLEIDGAAFEAIMRLQTALANGETVFEGAYRRRDLVGLDAVLAVDPLIFKVDAAYTFARTAYTQTYRAVKHPWLTAVAGVEYFDGDALQVIVEAFLLTIFDVPATYRLSLFEANEPLPPEGDRPRDIFIAGCAGVLRYALLDGDLSVELAAIATLSRGDVLFVPSLRYRIDDAQQIALGGTWVEGRDDGYGGVYSHNDQVSVSYQWTH